MKVAILGYGAIGKKRFQAVRGLREKYDIENIFVYDPFVDADIIMHSNLKDIETAKPDWVIIATPNDVMLELFDIVADWNTNILVEKPFGRNFAEATRLYLKIRGKNRLLVGHNYRFFEGIAKLIEDVHNNVFGDLISVNMSLAHGGNPTDNQTWRLNAEKAGRGGSFLDLGTHLLDIAIQIENGNSVFHSYQGIATNSFWNENLLEETHLLFCHGGCIFNLQTSMTRWANNFRVEVNGKDGYGIVQGRGSFYGTQTYIRGKRWGWMDSDLKIQPEELVVTSDCSKSFYYELDAIFGNDQYYLTPCTDDEAVEVMALYQECFNAIIKRR